jgi:nucleoside-diphosphate-sugar epimerase
MAGKKVLIAGASGVVGSAAVERFLDAGWDVVALSRRRPEVARDEFEHVAVDLRDRDAVRALLGGRADVSAVAYAAVHEKPGLIAGWGERDQMEANDAMLRNLLDTLAESSEVEHLSLLQGTKAYGVHLHPIPTPARERLPRDDSANFYWLQEDYIREVAERTGMAFTIVRPQVIFGGVYGVAMNVLPVIGAYAALCVEEGLPFSFPGGPDMIQEAVDARLMADALEWAAGAPAARNETFNVTNGDVYMWREVWPAIADALGVEPGADERRSVVEFLAPRAERWAQITERRDLRRTGLDELCGESHHYADLLFGNFLEETPPHALVSTIKLRQAGFATFYDSEDTFRYWLGQLIERGVIPYLG